MEIDGSFSVTVDRTAWGDISLTLSRHDLQIHLDPVEAARICRVCGRRLVTARRRMTDVRPSLRQPNACALNCRPSRPVAAHRHRSLGHPHEGACGTSRSGSRVPCRKPRCRWPFDLLRMLGVCGRRGVGIECLVDEISGSPAWVVVGGRNLIGRHGFNAAVGERYGDDDFVSVEGDRGDDASGPFAD